MTEQRICIKFYVKNNIKFSELVQMLEKAFGKNGVKSRTKFVVKKSKPRVYEWCKCFQEGHEGIEDDKRIGHPTTSTTEKNTDKIKDIVLSNHLITCLLYTSRCV